MPPTLHDALHPAAVPETCAHVSLRGTRCSRTPAEDQALCIIHGASILQARDVIQRRLLALQEKSIAVAEELMEFGDDKTRATVVVAIWDRTGLGPKSTVEIEDKVENLESLSLDELIARRRNTEQKLRAISLAQRMHGASDEEPPRAPVTH